MIKKLFFTLVILSTLFSFGQFSVKKDDGTPINNGDTFTYSSNVFEEAELTFIVTNDSGMNIRTLVEVLAFANTDGSQMQLCYTLCYDGVSVGNTYPGNAVVLSPGESTSPFGNHFVNTAPGDDTNVPVTYQFRFMEVDNNDNMIGTPIDINYVYDATVASVTDLNQIDFELYPTVTKNSVNLKINETVNFTIINVQGQTVKQLLLAAGTHQIDLSGLAKQLYFVELTNAKGEKSLSKIITK